MIGIIFCLASFLLGTSIALYFRGFPRIEEKFTLGIILGFTLTTWITFILSLIIGSLNIKLILVVTIISVFFSLALLKYAQKKKFPSIILPSKTYLLTIILFSLIFSLVNFNTFKFDTQGNLRAMSTAWGDYALHLTYMMHFSEKTPLTLNHPLLVKHKLIYPFLTDFLSAIMYKGGLSYVNSIVFINLILGIGLISIIFLFTKEFSHSEIAALFCLLLLFLNGNFGFLFALGKEPKEIFFAQSFYTKIDSKGLVWGNALSVLFLSQRTIIWGMAISVFIYLILLKEFFKNNEPRISVQNLILGGFLLGCLPLIHTSSFIVLIFVSLILFIFRLRKEWIYFIVPAIIVSLPQVFYLISNTLHKSFWLKPGWMLNSPNPILIFLFWIYNFGFIFFLLIKGLFLVRKKEIIFYLPFLIIFLLANFIMVHPLDWDNAKYFLHWFFISCVIASFTPIKILETSRWKKPDRLFLVIILLFFSVFSGVIDYIYLNRISFVMANKKEQAIASWVRKNITPSALILTSDTHNHPVSMLSGRSIILGYRGWLWSHGYKYDEIEKDIQEIYRIADLTFIKKYKITHIVISPYEKELKPNLRTFLKSNRFKEIYKTEMESGFFRIFEVNY
ncbi:MAG: hypothetical protein NC818_05185 [Candidatus Omnitrophica bacterium]|nr:hypothetical protein [Candidatus Omnitrophota bacterium]